VRCTTAYSPEEEQKRKTKIDMNKTHASYMKHMKANNNMNSTRVMHMTMQERFFLLQHMEYTNQWKQVSLKALGFFMEKETNTNPEPIMTTTKREQCKQYKRKLTKEPGRSN
jgi:ATP-dependent phosphoenolpyruvate carboxykinase